MKPSLARLFVIAFAVAAALAAVAGALLFGVSALREAHVHAAAPSYAPHILANQIAQTLGAITQATQAVARAPLTLRILRTSDEQERRNGMTTLASLYPQLGEIALVAHQDAALAPIATAGARQHPLLERARGTGGATLRAESLRVSISEPVHDEAGQIAGYVLVERELAELRHLFAATPLIYGYAELQQVNGNLETLIRRGNEQLKRFAPSHVLPLPGTSWKLVVWSPEPPQIVNVPLYQVYLAVAAIFLVLLALVGWIAYRAADRALQADLTRLTKLFSDVSHDRMRKQYGVALKETQNAYQVMYQLGKLMVGKHLRAVSSAGIDHLSQVSNRRSFEAKQREVFQRVSEGWAHSLLIIDIDGFKQVNDNFGHDAGDQLIVQFGKLLKQNLRSSDFVARLGGDEFCVIFPNTPLARAAELAERLRRNLPERIELLPGVVHPVAWSGGLSEYSRHDQSENAALARADQALLDAKRAGRNRTEIKAAA